MAESNQQGCLFVGEGVVLKGNFEVPDIASISGTVEGEITAKQVLIEATGVVRGKLTGGINRYSWWGGWVCICYSQLDYSLDW